MSKKKQDYNPFIKDGEFVSPNRRTYRQLMSNGLKTERVSAPPVRREEPKVMNGRTKAQRKELAKLYGSTGTNLKKKHLNRDRKVLAEIADIVNEIKGLNNE